MKAAKTGLLDRLDGHVAAHYSKTGPSCCICVLPKEITAWVKKKLDDGEKQTAIAAALQAEGHKVGYQSVGHHARYHIKR